MTSYSTPYHVVYHIAAINHWQDVVREQWGLLLGNHNIKSVAVTIGAAAEEQGRAAARLIGDLLAQANKPMEPRFYYYPLDQFEHPAMALVDEIGRRSEHAVLYFHGKAVSYSPPGPIFEYWRQKLNSILPEADRWADYLAAAACDVCGPLQVFDSQHGFTYFGGNFWMAKSAYLRSLPNYWDFIQNPKCNYFQPRQRHLAEVAINRAKRMKPFATDGMSFTIPEFRRYILESFEREKPTALRER